MIKERLENSLIILMILNGLTKIYMSKNNSLCLRENI